jgi:hypothetical protein
MAATTVSYEQKLLGMDLACHEGNVHKQNELLTMRPSIICFSMMTRSATAGSANTMNPKPRARPVARSRMMTASTTSPYLSKYSRRRSSLVSHEMPPMNSFPASPSISCCAAAASSAHTIEATLASDLSQADRISRNRIGEQARPPQDPIFGTPRRPGQQI